MSKQFNTPILTIHFNRPEISKHLFAKLKEVKPNKLFIAIDGPREDRPGEDKLVEEVKSVFKDIDWECEVHTLYQEKNLGCRYAVTAAIDWFFSQVEYGIILEDDCIPHISFFDYSEEVLTKYEHDERVMVVTGSNFQDENVRGDGSYFFTRYIHIWGWATWKRAWDLYHPTWDKYTTFRERGLIKQLYKRENEQRFWEGNFNAIADGLDTWDYQWVFTVLANNGLTVAPNVNLISNIGFNSQATHTYDSDNPLSDRPTEPIGKIVHPTFMLVDQEADDYSAEKVFNIPKERSLAYKVARKIYRKVRFW